MKFFYSKKITIYNLFIIEFLLLQINECNTIKFKIKTWKFLDKDNINYINEKSNEEKYFYYDLILNNIYTPILIGSPPQQILGFYSGKINELDIIHNKCFINYSKYDRTKSNTFNNISSFNITHKNYKNGCFAKEDFQFELYKYNNNNDKNIVFNQLKFFLPDDSNISKNENININTCALLGLKLNDKDIFKETPKNFIYYLIQYNSNQKNENHLNNFYWTIKYNDNSNSKDNEGYFSIGDPPHIYDPDNYKKENFKEFNIEFSYSSLYWAIQFNEIYLNKSINNINKVDYNLTYLKKYFEGHKCLFYPEINVIFGTIEYFNTIKNEFFDKFISKRICFEKKIYISEYNSTLIEGLGGQYVIIYCDKIKVDEYGTETFFNEFPSINFYHRLMNYSFIFNAHELFYEEEKENKLYFLICRKNNEVDQWIFGKIFMKKYQVIFNSELRTIGFYINQNKNSNNNNINNIRNVKAFNNKGIIIAIVSIFFIFLITFILVIKYKKKFLTNKKVIVPELEMINKKGVNLI